VWVVTLDAEGQSSGSHGWKCADGAPRISIPTSRAMLYSNHLKVLFVTSKLMCATVFAELGEHFVR